MFPSNSSRGLTTSTQRRAAIVSSLLEKAAGDHLRLDLSRPFENIENARVAKNARDGIFEGEAIAAMDLENVVGRRPGDARAQQLRHASFNIAALVRILGARGKIGELARDVDFGCDQRQLVRDAREVDQRLAELNAIERIADAKFKRVLRNSDGARGGLDAGGFEGLHQLLEALSFNAAQQVRRGTSKPSKAISYSFMPR